MFNIGDSFHELVIKTHPFYLFKWEGNVITIEHLPGGEKQFGVQSPCGKKIHFITETEIRHARNITSILLGVGIAVVIPLGYYLTTELLKRII